MHRTIKAAAALLAAGGLVLASSPASSGAKPRPKPTRHVYTAADLTTPGPSVSGAEYSSTWHYGPDANQIIVSDMYSGRVGAPSIELVHGGSWINGSTANSAAEAKMFYSYGWQTFNIDYRRGAGVTFAMQLADVRAARAYILSRAADFHIAPDRLSIEGFSAGGHLAASAANLGGYSAALLVSGVLQPQRFPEAVAEGYTSGDASVDGEISYINSREQAMVGCAYEHGTGTECDQAWQAFEPEHGLGALTPPTYVMAGGDDPYFCADAANSFYYWLGYHGVAPRKLTIVPGLGHTNQVLLGSASREYDARLFIGTNSP